MKAIVYDHFGPADVLHLADAPMPEMRSSDLLVRVKAAGVNRADILQRNGAYAGEAFGESCLLGLEVAGEIIGIGRDVSGFAVGDRVMAIVGGGGYAEYARVDQGMAVVIPNSLTYVEAASVMESFVTAYEAVSHLAGVRDGDAALIHAAAGGVGSACVQVAKALGATVYATANNGHIADVRGIGADVVFDYRAEDFEKSISELTEGRGVDAVIDFVGGDYLERNLKTLRPGGVVVQVGLLSGDSSARIPLNLLLHRHLRLVGTVMKSRTADEKRAMVRRFAEGLLPLLAEHRVRPLVERVFPMAAAAEAQRYMERGGVFGKIVLEMPDR